MITYHEPTVSAAFERPPAPHFIARLSFVGNVATSPSWQGAISGIECLTSNSP